MPAAQAVVLVRGEQQAALPATLAESHRVLTGSNSKAHTAHTAAVTQMTCRWPATLQV